MNKPENDYIVEATPQDRLYQVELNTIDKLNLVPGTKCDDHVSSPRVVIGRLVRLEEKLGFHSDEDISMQVDLQPFQNTRRTKSEGRRATTKIRINKYINQSLKSEISPNSTYKTYL